LRVDITREARNKEVVGMFLQGVIYGERLAKYASLT